MSRFRELDDIAAERLNFFTNTYSKCTGIDTWFEPTGRGIFELREQALVIGDIDSVAKIDELTQLSFNIYNAKCKENILVWSPEKYRAN